MDPEEFKTDWLPKFLSHFKKELSSEQKETTICSLIDILESKEKFLLQSSLPGRKIYFILYFSKKLNNL